MNKDLLRFKVLKERRKSPFRERLSGIDLSKGYRRENRYLERKPYTRSIKWIDRLVSERRRVKMVAIPDSLQISPVAGRIETPLSQCMNPWVT